MKIILNLFSALLLVIVGSVSIASATGIPLCYTMGCLSAASFIPQQSGIMSATVYREVWTGEVLKVLSAAEKATFLEGITDYSKYVSAVGEEAQAIHLSDMGVLPEVLLNNTTYPIPVQELGVTDIIMQLDKYQTKQTPITDDELYALTVDKMKIVKDRHGLALSIAKIKKAIHALAPGNATEKMPVLLTTGDDDSTGRKMLTWADVGRLKRELDKLEIPEEGRRLVLCSDHVNDLCASDQKFQNQYYSRIDGKVYNQLGFEIFDYVGNPYFNPTTKTKLSFGAIPGTNDKKASVFFSMARAAKANGWTKMYASKAENDPANQRNMVAFRNYFVVMPTAEEARGALVSDKV